MKIDIRLTITNIISVTADILDEVEAALKKISKDLKLKCLGGGRIQHDADDKKIKVYGYSQVKDHSIFNKQIMLVFVHF